MYKEQDFLVLCWCSMMLIRWVQKQTVITEQLETDWARTKCELDGGRGKLEIRARLCSLKWLYCSTSMPMSRTHRNMMISWLETDVSISYLKGS